MQEKISRFLNKNKKVMIISLLFIAIPLLISLIVVSQTFLANSSKKNVGLSSEKTNFDKKEAGAWNITKSAKWTAKGEAEITFDVESILKSRSEYTDIILVLDVSGSMNGEKLDRVKSDTIELVNILLSNNKNKAGLVTFSTNSQIVSDLTNNKDELIEKVSSLTSSGNTNYYKPLTDVDLLLKDYVKEEGKECVVLFLTDGYPNEDTPNEEMQYSYLKNQYPFITVNGVQYEMGSNILEPVKKVTDNQFIADMETLNNVLFEASISPVEYENFEIKDYIDTDYFYVESEKDIKVRQGTITFDKDNQKITWNSDNFKSGSKSKMIIKIKLKEELIGVGGTYPTNVKEEIKSKLDDVIENVTSAETPVLKDDYKVIYDGNAPVGCRVDGVPEEKQHTVFDVVGLSDTVPKCEGYQFKGWKIDTKDINKVNDDYFIMPEADVTIKANWGKVSISKSMVGKVQKRMTLYDQVKEDYENDNHAKLYTGDTSTFTGAEKVYYYYGETPNNNVIFGDFCWQMYRTTDTGGVKMVYNGEPDSEGKCGSDRENHVGYGSRNRYSLSSNYMYGTDYTYDATTKTFTLSGETETSIWNDDTYQGLVGKYTCRNTTGSCSTLYYVLEYVSNTSAYVLPINSTTIYSQIGVSIFNENKNSPADVGYMYNKRYEGKIKSMSSTSAIGTTGAQIVNDGYYYYSDVIEFDEESKEYKLVNIEKIGNEDISRIEGKYTYMSSYDYYEANYIYYIYDAWIDSIGRTVVNYMGLSGNPESWNFVFADSIIEDETGSYVLDSKTIKTVNKIEWLNTYNDYKNKFYQASDGNIYYILNTTKTNMTHINLADDFIYGSSYKYNDETKEYTISGDTQHFYDWPNNFQNLKNMRYTCWNVSGTCKKISYIYNILNEKPYYVELENGIELAQALNEMLYDNNVNTTNSTIKNIIDLWYSKNMTKYTDFLEDTVWCNNRNISELGGFDQNSESLSAPLYFDYKNTNLTCINENDRFTVSKKNGNGALNYSVGLVTKAESSLVYDSYNKSPLISGYDSWSLTPLQFSASDGGSVVITSSGSDTYFNIGNSKGVRPTISLHKGIKYDGGDGTTDNPYVIDMDS